VTPVHNDGADWLNKNQPTPRLKQSHDICPGRLAQLGYQGLLIGSWGSREWVGRWGDQEMEGMGESAALKILLVPLVPLVPLVLSSLSLSLFP
jgi:hypothetical protein